MPVRSTFVFRFRRSRQARELARVLVALDRAAAEVRPVPVRRTRYSLGK